MQWLLYVGLAFGAALSVVAVVVATASASGGSELDPRPRGATAKTNCTEIAVRRPSRASVPQRWPASTAGSADIDCRAAGPGVIYVKLNDAASVTRAR